MHKDYTRYGKNNHMYKIDNKKEENNNKNNNEVIKDVQITSENNFNSDKSEKLNVNEFEKISITEQNELLDVGIDVGVNDIRK